MTARTWQISEDGTMLCLQGGEADYGICIEYPVDWHAPYSLRGAGRAQTPYWSIDVAQRDGERWAYQLDREHRNASQIVNVEVVLCNPSPQFSYYNHPDA